MSDPGRDSADFEKLNQDTQCKERNGDKRRDKRWEKLSKEKPTDDEGKTNDDVTEDTKTIDDDVKEDGNKRRKIKRDKRELKGGEETFKEVKSSIRYPEGTLSERRNKREKPMQVETAETFAKPAYKTKVAAGIVGLEKRQIEKEGTLTPEDNKLSNRLGIETGDKEGNTKPLRAPTEGEPKRKDEALKKSKPNEAVKDAEKSKEAIKGVKFTTKDNTDTVTMKQGVEHESKDKKKLRETGAVDDEGKKPGPRISGIGAGTVRNLSSGALKGSSVPLLLSMPAGGGGLSLLSAGLPPGRYVILPSTTTSVPSISSIPSTTSPLGGKAGVITPITHPPRTVAVASCSTVTTTTTATASTPSILVPPASSGRVVRQMSRGAYCGGRSVRGRRKSYTAAEKLAMIEAVESGQKKSNVADLFGVAPSTLACILLQKNKIRSDQMKVDLSRRRLRQSRQPPIVPAPLARASSLPGGDSEAGSDNPFVHFLSPLSPPRPPVFEESPEEIISSKYKF